MPPQPALCDRARPLPRGQRTHRRPRAKIPTLLVRFAIRSIIPTFAFRRRSIWRSKTIGGTCGVVEKNHQRHRACKSEQQETTTCCHRKLPKSKFRGAEAVDRIKYGKNLQNRLRLANRWCEYAAAMVSNSGAQRTFYGNANLELSRRSWRRDRVGTPGSIEARLRSVPRTVWRRYHQP